MSFIRIIIAINTNIITIKTLLRIYNKIVLFFKPKNNCYSLILSFVNLLIYLINYKLV